MITFPVEMLQNRRAHAPQPDGRKRCRRRVYTPTIYRGGLLSSGLVESLELYVQNHTHAAHAVCGTHTCKLLSDVDGMCM